MRAPRMFARRAAAVAVVGVLLGLVALVFDASLLFVPAVGLFLLGVVTPARIWLMTWGARAERRLTAERVIEDEPLEATIVVRRGRLVLGPASFEVTDPSTGNEFELTDELAPLRGERRASVRVVTRFQHRGLHRLAPPSLIVRDPLDLARARTAGAGESQSLLVLPRTEPVRWLAPGRGRRLQLPDGRAGAEAMAAVDLDGLRPYRQGTPASRIHWPAVARGAGLIERRLQADGDARPLVVLDARTASTPAVDAEPLDAAVRAAASLVLELARGGGCGLLLPGEQRATAIDRELITWPAAYARLALVLGGHRGAAPALAATSGRTGAMIYVAASPSPRLGAVLTGPGAAATVLVVPDTALVGGRPRGLRGPALATLSVSGCSGFLLGVGRDRTRYRTHPPRTAACAPASGAGGSDTRRAGPGGRRPRSTRSRPRRPSTRGSVWARSPRWPATACNAGRRCCARRRPGAWSACWWWRS